MCEHYAAIGGRSPLTELTLAQAAALQTRLGADIPVVVGMRNWTPFISDALADLAAKGVTHVIGIPLAPQFSTLSVDKYFGAVEAALPPGMRLTRINSFHAHPRLVEAFAERVRAARPAADEQVVFTAHSLPQRVIDNGDPYAAEVHATARAVAERAGIERYEIAFQSAGRTPEPWIGPDIRALIGDLAGRGVRRLLIVPIGFVCDHTEILFDIDIEARETAEACGATLRRSESLNTHPSFIAALEDLVRQSL
jgi:ferrochelatase